MGSRATHRSSAGLLLFRRRGDELEVFIAHMGGPFWARKDEGAWSIVKGEYDAATEDAFAAACREFTEETGSAPPEGPTLDLGEIRQSSGKRVRAWAVESDFDAATVRSNTVSIEWPRGSGRQQEFPEIDRAEWFDVKTAREKLVKGQRALLDVLEERLGSRRSRTDTTASS
jgi:predicted NUDIX family NTP pyrophosphohydrolase